MQSVKLRVQKDAHQIHLLPTPAPLWHTAFYILSEAVGVDPCRTSMAGKRAHCGGQNHASARR